MMMTSCHVKCAVKYKIVLFRRTRKKKLETITNLALHAASFIQILSLVKLRPLKSMKSPLQEPRKMRNLSHRKKKWLVRTYSYTYWLARINQNQRVYR